MNVVLYALHVNDAGNLPAAFDDTQFQVEPSEQSRSCAGRFCGGGAHSTAFRHRSLGWGIQNVKVGRQGCRWARAFFSSATAITLSLLI